MDDKRHRFIIITLVAVLARDISLDMETQAGK